MRTCPYCLYRFPSNATACPRCDVELPALSKAEREAESSASAAAAARPQRRAGWGLRPILLIGVAAVVAILLLAVVFGPRLLGTRQPTPSTGGSGVTKATIPPTQISDAQATSMAAFPTAAPPSGWRQWLVLENNLKLWLPDTYQAVNFTDEDWETEHAGALLDSYLRNQANLVKAGSTSGPLLAAVSARSDAVPVRLLLFNAPDLARSRPPSEDEIRAFLNKPRIEGKVLNARELDVCGSSKTRVEVVPENLNDPNAWRGYGLAVTEDMNGYVLVALVNPRNFPTARETLEKILDSVCNLAPGTKHIPEPTPTPTTPPTPTRVPATPTPRISPSPAGATPSPGAKATSTQEPTARPTPSGPTPTPAPTRPAPPSGWREQSVQDEAIAVWLPETYTVVDFTIDDWQSVYSTTLVSDSYLRLEAVRVRLGTDAGTRLAAALPLSGTASVRVLLLDAPELAGESQPTARSVQALVNRAGIDGSPLGAIPLQSCGLQRIRFEIAPAPAAGPEAGRGFVVAATGADEGYLLIALVDPDYLDQVVDDLQDITDSLCVLSP